MKLKDLSKAELEAMNYDDIAYIILKEKKEQMKINELFKCVCKCLGLSDHVYEEKITDFFELLMTDKRFLMLENGSWDLKENHNPKIVVDDEEDETVITEENEDDIQENQENEDDIFYDTDTDDDLPDDDLEDLVVIDVDEEEANN